MKTFLRCVVTLVILLGMHTLSFGQKPNLGRSASFVLFSANGPVSHTGISQISGKVGTNIGSNTNFGNVNGGMHSQDSMSANAATDLLIAHGQIDTVTANFFIASPFGNGDTLIAGTYELGAASQLSGNLFLNAKGDSNAYFIIRVKGALNSAANAKVHLLNGAQACNVFWQVEGAMTMATGTFIRGSFIVNNGAIILNTLDSLEGRLMTTVGDITVNGISANLPIGCGSLALTGPAEFNMGPLACYALFSKNGAVTNTGVTRVTGDVGTNVALTTGFDSLLVEGRIHPIPDTSTARAADSLTAMYTFLNTLAVNIELMKPAEFGRNLILTPHVYLLDAATQFDDSLFLDAQGDSNAVFVIKVNGAFTTNSGSKVILRNGAKANKVYWKIDGALSIASNSFFKGTVVVNNGAINVATGVRVDGRLMTTTGLLNTTEDTIRSFQNCSLAASPIITTEPVNRVVCSGQSALFSVQATGTALTYRWRRNNVNLVNGGNISGATSDSLRINPATAADTAGTYTVIVFGSTLPNDTSVAVRLSINANTLITNEPINQLFCAGSLGTVSVTAVGTTLSFQWRKGNVNLTNGGNFSGVNTSVLSFLVVGVADTASNYNVIVSGACGSADTSILVSVSLATAPLIVIEPINKTACTATSTFLAVSASGTGLTYQWRKGNVNLVNGGNISGATSTTLVINPATIADAAANYNVIVFGSCLPNDTSLNAALTISATTLITAEPVSQVVCTGSSIHFTATASGSGLTYQWRKGNVNIVNGGNITGAQGDTLFLNPATLLDQAANYNVIVTGGCGVPDTSVFASLVMNSLPVITTEPVAQTLCQGASMTLSVVATGSGLSYQWRKGNVVLTNAGNVSGVGTATLTINPIAAADAGFNYNVIVTGGCLPADTSVMAAVVVNTAPVVINQPVIRTECAGAAASFTVNASGTGLTYQWRRGVNLLVNAGTISGVTTPTLAFSAVSLTDAANDYNVVVSGTCAPAVTTTNVALVVNTAPVIVAGPGTQTVCAGSSVSFNVNASGAGIFYQWRKGIVNLANGGNITGANSATLTLNPVTAADAATDYNVVVGGTCAPSASTANASLLVNALPAFQTAPTNQAVCDGGTVTFSSTALGSGISYQWFRGLTALSNSGNLSGTTSNSLTINPATAADAATDYYLVVTGICAPNARSADVSLTIENPPLFITQPKDTITCIGCSVSFSTTASGDGLTYQWRRGTTDLIDGGAISGVNTNTLVINPATLADNDFNYNVVVSGNCPVAIRSDNASLLVCIPISVEDISGDEANKVAVLYPNPFVGSVNAVLKSTVGLDEADLVIYNTLGVQVIESVLTREAQTFEAHHLPAGVYYYRVISQGVIIQTGKLVSNK